MRDYTAATAFQDWAQRLGPVLVDRTMRVYSQILLEGGYGHDRSKGLCRTQWRGKAFRVPDTRPLLCNEAARARDRREHHDVRGALPAGTASLYHLHRDSDEVAWVLAGQFTFKIGAEVAVGGPGTCAFMPRNVPHAWKNTGSETGRVLFLYTPAAAGGLIEALSERRALAFTELSHRTRRNGRPARRLAKVAESVIYPYLP
jgi:mannose-6-phosphate isomerase-like protein (cupin superfamily)